MAAGSWPARDRLPGPQPPELTGPVYAGHVFWDAEVFVLAVLAAVHPAAARAMVEYRIVADVLWAARRYADWTGDTALFDGPGRELLLDTARYWASRARWDDDGLAHIEQGPRRVPVGWTTTPTPT